MVAVAMTWRVAVRKPPTMTDDASGSSIAVQDLAFLHAHPAAASISSRSTERRPA